MKGQEATDTSCNAANFNEILGNNFIVEIVDQWNRIPEELCTPDPSLEAQLDQGPSNLICSEWKVSPVASRGFFLSVLLYKSRFHLIRWALSSPFFHFLFPFSFSSVILGKF